MAMGMINGKPTVAYRLFNNVYPVKIQNMFLVSNTEKRHRPGYNSDDPAHESQTRMENTTVYRTPVGMTLLYDKGIIPYIVNKEDVLTIYDLITRHLNNWTREIQNPVSVLQPPPPVELLQLENFSQFIYEDAMFEQGNQDAKTRLANHDNTLENFLSLFGGRAAATQLRTTATTDPQQLANLADAWDANPW